MSNLLLVLCDVRTVVICSQFIWHDEARDVCSLLHSHVKIRGIEIENYEDVKRGMSWHSCANLTLCQLHYVYLREGMVQIAYAPLEASAVGIREVCGCTPIRVRPTVPLVTTRYIRFGTALQGLNYATTHAQ